MNYFKLKYTFFFLNIAFINCNNISPAAKKLSVPFSSTSLHNIIPKPVEITATGFAFELTKESTIFLNDTTPELLKLGRYFSNKLKPATGFPLRVLLAAEKHSVGNIYFSLGEIDSTTNAEAYELNISEDSISLKANTTAGLFRGMQTIRQLFPEAIESDSVQHLTWQIATGKIKDYPSYEMRGAMLDIARHFFGVEDIKRYIDLISFYKMNVLHLHLSDDQGWRIEIKKWPKLCTHGGTTKVGGGKGGYLTQEQYKEIVQYASEKYITIIP
jgi:hexosaminidase